MLHLEGWALYTVHMWTNILYTRTCWTHGDQCVLASVGYIGEFEFVDDHRGGKLVVELNGR
jgi:hypothetical protein